MTRNVVDRHLRQEVTLGHVVARTVTADRSALRGLTIPAAAYVRTCNGLLEADEQVVARVLERLAERYYHLVVNNRQVAGNHHLREVVPIVERCQGSILGRGHVNLELSCTPVCISGSGVEGQLGDRIPEDLLQTLCRNDELAGSITLIYVGTIDRYVAVGIGTIVYNDRVDIGRQEGDHSTICALSIQLTAICLHASVVGSLSGQTGQVSYRLGNVQHERVRHIAIETVLNLPCLCLTSIPGKLSHRTITRSQLSCETCRSRTSDRRTEGLHYTPVAFAILTTVRTYVYIIGMRCQEIREDVRSIVYIDQVRKSIRIECSDCIQSDLPCALTFLTCTPRQFSRVCIDIRSSQVDRFETGQLPDAEVINCSGRIIGRIIIISPDKNYIVQTGLNSDIIAIEGLPCILLVQTLTTIQCNPTSRQSGSGYTGRQIRSCFQFNGIRNKYYTQVIPQGRCSFTVTFPVILEGIASCFEIEQLRSIYYGIRTCVVSIRSTSVIGDIERVRTLTIVSGLTISPCVSKCTIDECPSVLSLKVVCIRDGSRSLLCYKVQGLRPVILVASYLYLNIIVICIIKVCQCIRTLYVLNQYGIRTVDVTQVEACLAITVPVDRSGVDGDISSFESIRQLARLSRTERGCSPEARTIGLTAVRTYVHVI